MMNKERCVTRLSSLLGLALLGCSVIPQSSVPSGSGSYVGVTATGQPMTLNLEQDGQAIRGHGTVGAEQVAIAGSLAWTAVGALVGANGFSSRRELRLSGDGAELTLIAPGGDEVVLERQGEPSPAASGPFAGIYEAEGEDAAFIRAAITQSGNLLAGAATLLGRPAGITGRVTSASFAEGMILFADGSQAQFEAEISADGQLVTVRGLGAPTTLRRR